MEAPGNTNVTWEQAQELLGVGPNASEEQVRAAYLEKVRQHPPDQDPELFEGIRDAYQQLRDPWRRAEQVLRGPDPLAPLSDWLQGTRPQRRFAGWRMWLELLKEKRQGRS